MQTKEYMLSDISTMKYGKMLAKSKFTEAGNPVYSGYRVTGYTNEYLYEQPMVVVVARGVGGTGDVKISPPKAWITNLSIVLDTDDEIVDKYYLYCLLNQEGLKEKLDSGASISQITISSLEPYKIVLPSFDEQKKRTDILKAYDNLIENNNRRIAILEDMAQSLYREWFVKFRYPGHENQTLIESPLGAIPEGWEVKQIQDFGTVITGKTPSKKKEEYYSSKDVPFLKTPDMHGSTFAVQIEDSLSIAGADSQKNKYIPKNSICVACIGAKAGVVTLTADQVQTNQQINSVVLFDQKDREYFYLFAVSLHQKIHALGSSGATMTNVSKGKFETIEVLKPSSEVMERFSTAMKPVFDQIENLQRRNINLQNQRDMLLPKLISGKIEL